MKVILNSYAKINPYLFVESREADYHIIDGYISRIALHSSLTFEINKSSGFENNISIFSEGKEVDYKPIKKAIKLWAKERRYPVDVTLNIEDPLPLEAGLGAMSSYAASTIKALEIAYENENKNEPFYEPMSIYKKLLIAEFIGMDTMFFITDLSCAHISGYGNIISPIKRKVERVILHFPDYKCPTKRAYEELDEENVEFFIDVKKNKTYHQWLSKKTNTDKWQLSGSGSTFFIINPTTEIIEKLDEWNAMRIKCVLTTTLK